MSAVHWACQSMFSREPTLVAPKAAVMAETMCCRSQGNSQGMATMRNTTYLTHNCKCRTTWLHMIMFQGQVLAQDMQYTCAIACVEAARPMESSSFHVEKPDHKMSIHFSVFKATCMQVMVESWSLMKSLGTCTPLNKTSLGQCITATQSPVACEILAWHWTASTVRTPHAHSRHWDLPWAHRLACRQEKMSLM